MRPPARRVVEKLIRLGQGFESHGRADAHLLMELSRSGGRTLTIGAAVGQQVWDAEIEGLGVGNTTHLFKGLVVLRQALGRGTPSVASEVWLLYAIRERDNQWFSELADWAADYTDSDYMPIERRAAPLLDVPRSDLPKEDAALAYARAWNTLHTRHLEPWLAEDVCYTSQHVFDEINCKADYLSYLEPKMKAVANSDMSVFAELGETRTYPGYNKAPEPCVVMAQGSKDDFVGIVCFETRGGFIQRIDLLTVAPIPTTAHRTGRYPK